MVTPTLKTGVGRYLENILSGFSKIEDYAEFFVFLGSNQRDIADKIKERLKVEISKVSTEQSFLNFLRLQFFLPILCKKKGINILHIPNEKLLLFKPCPLVLTIHDVADFKFPMRKSFLRRFFRRIAMPTMLRKADHIIAVSENTKMDLIKIFNIEPKKITVIYEGASHNLLKKPELEEIKNVHRKYNIKSKFILFVGEISKRKNLEFLINNFRTNKDSFLKYFQLVLVGKNGNASKRVNNLIKKHNLQNRVILTGYISEYDLKAIYYSAFCLVLPSIYEGFGLPIIEAMRCKLPVICSNSGSLPEIIGDVGLLFENLNSKSLSYCLRKLINDKSLQFKLKSMGYERSRQFSWDNCSIETMNIYKKLNKIISNRD
ncbi:MAG: glycosyltransferase family 4 protein [Promethearchaeota archaeon]